MSLDKCGKCSTAFSGKRYFSYKDGIVTCFSCKTLGAYEISPVVHNVLRLCQITEYEKIVSLNLPDKPVLEALKILLENFHDKFDRKINITF